jgi:alpha,alpha-trehalase
MIVSTKHQRRENMGSNCSYHKNTMNCFHYLLLLHLTTCVEAITMTPQQRVYQHVQQNANLTFRPPSGILKYKYLVPAGPYEQMWDWDSLFMGVAMFPFGSGPYLEGAMANFLDHTNETNGHVEGCLLPSGGTGTIFHAKPIVIQGAWLASKQSSTIDFQKFSTKMKALLAYWSSKERTDHRTGLPKWYNQLESGQDNLVLSTCASNRSKCWVPELHEMVLVSADVATFLYREYQAYSAFNLKWAKRFKNNTKEHVEYLSEVKRANQMAIAIKKSINQYLWNDELGYYIALNTSDAAINTGNTEIKAKTDVMGFPLWAGIPTSLQAKTLRSHLLSSDMFSKWGIRSTSSNNKRYNNLNEIVPYSNWQGPVWVNANAVISFGLTKYGYMEDSIEIANRVVQTLSNDLLRDNTWHEGYDSENGTGLAANGFLSWDTLVATWPENIVKRVDPFEI